MAGAHQGSVRTLWTEAWAQLHWTPHRRVYASQQEVIFPFPYLYGTLTPENTEPPGLCESSLRPGKGSLSGSV